MRFLPAARRRPLLAISVAAALSIRLAFGVEPTENAEATAASVTVRSDKADFDLAKLNARARVVYVSTGAIAFTVRLMDNDLETGFRFSGADLYPTVIVEIAQTEPLHRVGAVFNPEEKAKLEVYLLNELPNHPGDLSGAQPLNCVVERGDVARGWIDFEPRSARYVAFRWIRQRRTRLPFAVAEVSAFSTTSATQIPPLFGETDIHLTGESQLDFSNSLGTLADPPRLAVTSP